MTDHRVHTAALLSAAPLAAALLAVATPARSTETTADAAPAARSTVTSFSTPSGNIRCVAVREGRRWSLRCDTLQHQWQPPARECGDYGDNAGSVAMGKRKASRFICVSDAVDPGRVVGYGQTWQRGPFTCKSRRTGLKCYNLGGHGWRLSRENYRLF